MRPFPVFHLGLGLSAVLSLLLLPATAAAQASVLLPLTPPVVTLSTGVAGGSSMLPSATYSGPAAGQAFNQPQHIASDPAGNLYIADYQAQVIRKIDNSGTMTTIAGTGVVGYGGDGGAATAALFNGPYCVVSDPSGNLFVCDLANRAVRRIDHVSGKISTVAGGHGSGATGDGGPATSATFASFHDLWVDALGNIYIADTGNDVLRVVYNGGTILGVTSPVVGNIYRVAGTYGTTCAAPAASPACGDTASALSATMTSPDSLTVDTHGNIFFTDGTARVRAVAAGGSLPGISSTTAGYVYTIVGNGVACSASAVCGDGGPGTSAQVNSPIGIVVDAANKLYFADRNMSRLRRIDIGGTITGILGGHPTGCAGSTDSGFDGCNASVGKASGPAGVALDAAGDLYFVDAAYATGNATLIRRIGSAFVSIYFGQERTGGTSPTHLVTVSNPGTTPITLSSLTFSGPFSQAATGSTDCTATTVLAAGNTCALGVVFSPTAVSTYTGTVSIGSNATLDEAGHNSVGLQGSGVVSQTRLRVTPSPANTGSLMTFQANVPFNNLGTIPTGTVTFYNGGAIIGPITSLDTNGVAAFSSSSLGLSTGTHSITASYSGDTNYSASSTANPVYVVVTTSAIAPNVSATVAGSESTVFHYATDACEAQDYPDASAHAYKDSSGMVHMFAPHYVNYGFTGSLNLLTVTHSCHLSYVAGASSDPSAFDDQGWIESFYTTGDNSVAALVSMDYHPSRHSGVSPCTPNAAQCWYSTITQASSTNGGVDFTAPAQGSPRFVAGAPYVYSNTFDNTVGALVPTNIISSGGYYYAMISVAGAYAQTYGECVMRTTDPTTPSLWRAWDGSGYNVSFYDPYLGGSYDPAQHVCTPVSLATPLYAPVRTILKLNGGGFALIMSNSSGADPAGAKEATVLTSTSLDMVNWSRPVNLIDLPLYNGANCTGAPLYGYASLIDPLSTSPSFETTGSTPYVYLTKYMDCSNNLNNRDLVKYPINLSVNP